MKLIILTDLHQLSKCPLLEDSCLWQLLSNGLSIKWIFIILFLHGDLDEEVYMKLPLGLDNPDKKVCKLKKSLYGLKHRQWFHKLPTSFATQCFIQSKNDYNLFITNENSHIIIVAVYVDEILVTGSDLHKIDSQKKILHSHFTTKNLGLHFFWYRGTLCF